MAEREIPFQFELTGGRPCLDLVNTVDSRPTDRPVEHLNRYEDLVAWCEQSGQITRREGGRLRAEARERPRRARAALRRAVELREALFDLFSAATGRRAFPREALATFNRHLPESLSRLRLEIRGESPAWQWDAGDEDLGRLLLPVIDDAADLLTSPDLSRVRECGGGRCAWLFMDNSRNGSRRWCDMSVCGNRAKARRHYERARSGS